MSTLSSASVLSGYGAAREARWGEGSPPALEAQRPRRWAWEVYEGVLDHTVAGRVSP